MEILAAATKAIPSAGIAKVSLVYDRPWWSNAGLSGSMESVRGPIIFTRENLVVASSDDVKYMDEDVQERQDLFGIDCYIGGKAGREWLFGDLSAKEKEEQMLAQLVKVFGTRIGNNSILQPIEILPRLWDGSKDEAAEEIREGYHLAAPALPVGILTASGSHENLEKLSDPFGNVYFVGAEFATEWRGLAEGALRSGIRGAREVMASLGKKGRGWQSVFARL